MTHTTAENAFYPSAAQLSPVVSVVMPTYNKSPHLREAIASVAAQTFPGWELIVVDDGSTDNTSQVLAQYRDVRIKVHTLPSNVGRSRARNIAIGHAKGRYIAICDSDDVSAATRFERQVSFLDSHPEIGIVSSFIQVLSPTATTRIAYTTDHASIARRFAAGRMGVAHGASMIRAECFQRLGTYCEDLPSAEDFELFRRFSTRYLFGILPEVQLDYRNELGKLSLRRFVENSRAHRYAIYRSDPRPAGDQPLTLEEFCRGWKTKLAIYTLDALRFAHFSLRAHVFSRYVVR
jgi:glycosyltransferase involved in cell wall biosynthesis